MRPCMLCSLSACNSFVAFADIIDLNATVRPHPRNESAQLQLYTDKDHGFT